MQLMLFSGTVEVYCGNDGENNSNVCNAELSNVECRDVFYYMALRWSQSKH